MAQENRASVGLPLEPSNYPDTWEQPMAVEEEDADEDYELDSIAFPEITSAPSEQPAIIGEESGNNAD